MIATGRQESVRRFIELTALELGWTPEITVLQMCREMVASDLQEAQRHALLKANGYQVNVSVE